MWQKKCGLKRAYSYVLAHMKHRVNSKGKSEKQLDFIWIDDPADGEGTNEKITFMEPPLTWEECPYT